MTEPHRLLTSDAVRSRGDAKIKGPEGPSIWDRK